MKPKFNPEINWGHVLMATTFLLGFIPIAIAWGTDIKLMQKDINRLEEFERRQQAVNEKLTENQNAVILNLSEFRILVKEHMSKGDKKDPF